MNGFINGVYNMSMVVSFFEQIQFAYLKGVRDKNYYCDKYKIYLNKKRNKIIKQIKNKILDDAYKGNFESFYYFPIHYQLKYYGHIDYNNKTKILTDFMEELVKEINLENELYLNCKKIKIYCKYNVDMRSCNYYIHTMWNFK
jgi:uncharacterized protein YktA (UPF0223 family)